MDAQDFASVWQGEHFHGVRMVVDGELIDHYAFEYGDNSLDVAKQYGAEPFEQLLDVKMDEWVKHHDRMLKNTNDALQAENAKLREERDHWHVEQVHAYGNWEDAYRRAAELETENAKLRDLTKEMFYSLLNVAGGRRIMTAGEAQNLMDRMSALGVEVDS